MKEPHLLGDAHFWIGCLSVISGFTAFAARKGQTIHRACGTVFVLSMVLLTASGLWLSIAREILFTVFLSAIAFHTVATGWAAAALERPVGGLTTKASAALSGFVVVGAVHCGMRAAAAPNGMFNELPASAFYTVAGVGFFIFVCDIAFALVNKPTRQRRLTRHLWRMGFSFFLATGIFFFGNNHVLPEMLRYPAFLSAPVVAAVLWTLFYMFRIRFSKQALTYAQRS